MSFRFNPKPKASLVITPPKVVLIEALLGAVLAAIAPAQKSPETGSSPFVSDFLGQVDFVEGRILALNKAMAEKESWRPAEGVRSVSETYLHIAFGNYILTK